MSKLTAKQIDDRAARMAMTLTRALERGDINNKTFEEGMRDLARWCVHKYSQLPPAQAVEAITGLLLGEKK